jgi:hypothetical protein
MSQPTKRIGTMRATGAVTLAGFLNLLAASAHAQIPEAECSTTTTSVTCKGSAAPLAVPALEQPSPPSTQWAPLPALPPPADAYPQPGYELPRLYVPPMKTHVEERARLELVVAGAAIFGGSYLLNAMAGYLSQEGTLAIPVLGPILFGQKNISMSCDHCFDGGAGNRLGMVMLVFDSLVQAAGVTLLIAGAVTKKKVTVFDKDGQSVAVLPTAGSSSAGLVVSGTF